MKVFANTLKPAAVSTHHSTQLSDVKLYFCQEKKHNTNEPVAEHREKVTRLSLGEAHRNQNLF